MIRLLALAATLFGLFIASTTLFTDARAHAAGGDLLWQDQFNLAGGDDFASAVASSDRRVVAVGVAQAATGNSIFVVRAYHTERGTLVWEDRVQPNGSDAFAFSAAVVMDDDLVVILGNATDATGNFRTLIRAYAAESGALAWTKDQSGMGGGLALEGSHIMTSSLVVDASGNRRLLVREYAKNTGALAWEDEWRPPVGRDWIGPASVVAKDGKAFVGATLNIGVSFDPTLYFACLFRSYKIATGTLLWQSSSASPQGGHCLTGRLATDGKRLVVAEGGGGAVPFDFQVESYDAATGEWLWRDGENHDGYADGAAAVDIERGVAFVIGTEYRPVPPYFGLGGMLVLRAYDTTTGELRWEDAFPPDVRCDCFGIDVVVDKGRVFAVGSRLSGAWFVRAYDSRSGSLLWHDEFALVGSCCGNFSSSPAAVAADHGRVFVAGWVLNAAGNLDFVLRTYEAK